MNRALIRKIEEVTKLSYCDKDCYCDENDHLLWQNSGVDYPAWLPDWCNGIEPRDMYDWLFSQSQMNAEIRNAMIDARMRVQKEQVNE